MTWPDMGTGMRVAVDIRVLELLTARLCHELVSSVGAINNGVEILGEDDPDFVRDAVELIGQSARRAGKRLQFYRFAYGTASGSATAGPPPSELVAGILEGGKVACDWEAGVNSLPFDWQKLACNVVVLAAEMLPRGGSVAVRRAGADKPGLEVVAAGETLNLTPELRSALGAEAVVDDLTSRTIHAYFTARLAQGMGAAMSILAPPSATEITLRASAA
jgi:histidine phosphotransferase ChpT